MGHQSRVMATFLSLLVSLLSASLFADSGETGATGLYERERALYRRRTVDPQATLFEMGAGSQYFAYNFRSTDGVGGPDMHWDRALDLSPTAFIWELRFARRWTWDDMFSVEYQGLAISGDNDDATAFDVRLGENVIASGEPLSADAMLHHFLVEYRRNLLFVDPYYEWPVFATAGLTWDFVRMGVNAETAPIKPDRETMRELRPIPVVGLGIEWQRSTTVTRAYARAAYLPAANTQRLRRGEWVEQASQFYEAAVESVWRTADWCSITFFVRARVWQHELDGDGVHQLFRMTAAQAGVRLGITNW